MAEQWYSLRRKHTSFLTIFFFLNLWALIRTCKAALEDGPDRTHSITTVHSGAGLWIAVLCVHSSCSAHWAFSGQPLGLLQPLHIWGFSPHSPFLSDCPHTYTPYKALQENRDSCRAVSASSQNLSEAVLHSSVQFPIPQKCKTPERNTQSWSWNSSLRGLDIKKTLISQRNRSNFVILKDPRAPESQREG